MSAGFWLFCCCFYCFFVFFCMIWSNIIIFSPPEHRKHHLNLKWGDLIFWFRPISCTHFVTPQHMYKKVTIYSIIDWWPVFQPRLPNLINVGEPPKHFQRYRLIGLSMCPIFFLVTERNSMSSLFLKRTQEDQGLALKGLNPWEQMCAGPRTDVCPSDWDPIHRHKLKIQSLEDWTFGQMGR